MCNADKCISIYITLHFAILQLKPPVHLSSQLFSAVCVLSFKESRNLVKLLFIAIAAETLFTFIPALHIFTQCFLQRAVV